MRASARTLGVLVGCAAFAVLGFTFGSPTYFQSPAPIDAAGAMQWQPQLIAAPGGLFAFWLDFRDEYFTLYSSRVDPLTLAPVTPGGIRFERTNEFAAAYGGTSYASGGYVLATWETGGPVHAARLYLDGGISSVFSIDVSPHSDNVPGLASNTDEFLFAYVDELSAPDSVRAVFLDPSGAPISATDRLLSTAGTLASNPRVAYAGTQYLVTWTEGQNNNAEVQAARVSRVGTVVTYDSPSMNLSNAAGTPDVLPEVAGLASGDFFVSWNRGPDTGRQLMGATVTAAGTFSTNTLVADAGEAESYSFRDARPSVLATATDVLVAWGGTESTSQFDQLRIARVPSPYTAASQVVVRSSNPSIAAEPSLALLDGGVFIAYTDSENSGEFWDTASQDVFVEMLNASLAPATGSSLITTAPVDQRGPSLAFDGQNMLAAWAEYHRDGGYDVFLGDPLDGGGLSVPITSDKKREDVPSITASDAGIFLLAWADVNAGNVKFARFDGSGNRIGPASSTVGSGDRPCVAYGDGVFLVAITTGFEVFARRYDLNGTAIDTSARALCTGCLSNWRPNASPVACAFDGDHFLVAWGDIRVTNGAVKAARVYLDGGLPDPEGFTVCAQAEYPEDIAAVNDGTQLLLAWHDHRNGNGEVWSTRLSGTTALDPIGVRLVPPGGEQKLVALSPVPGGVMLAYDDMGSENVYITHVVNGAPTGSRPAVYSQANVHGLSIASTPAETVLLIEQADTNTPSSVSRLQQVRITRAAGGTSCTYGFDCQSGVCSAGSCTVYTGGTGGGAGGGTGGGAGGGTGGGAGGGSGGGDSTDGGDIATDRSALQLAIRCGCHSSPVAGWAPTLLLLALYRMRRSKPALSLSNRSARQSPHQDG